MYRRKEGLVRAFLQVLELDRRVLFVLALIIMAPCVVLYFQMEAKEADTEMVILQTKVAALEQAVYGQQQLHLRSNHQDSSSSSQQGETNNNPSSCPPCKAQKCSGTTSSGQGMKGPGRKVAVVVPIYRPMWERAWQGFMNWKKEYNYPACNTSLGYQKSVDLVFWTNKYFDGSEEANTLKLNQIVGLLQSMGVAKCFGEIVFLNADLDDELDPETTRNNIAISAMFWRLFKSEELLKKYDYFFHMETDTRPIRPYWRDMLYEEIEYSHDEFWLMGTLYRGPNNPREWCYNLYLGCAEHINGNAIYRLGDSVWLDFLERAERAQDMHWGYDAFIMNFLKQEENWSFFQRWAPNFRYSEFIQHGQTLTVPDVIKEFPRTYFLHQPRD